jgi:multidrug transporter EmrE-like cation transporter
MPLSWLALFLTIGCSASANALANWSHRFSGIKRLMVLGTAIGVHVAGLACFSLALTRIPLGIAYPVLIGGSMVAITLIAVVWFRERLTRQHVFGLGLIIVGMVLLKGGLAAPSLAAGVSLSGGG